MTSSGFGPHICNAFNASLSAAASIFTETFLFAAMDGTVTVPRTVRTGIDTSPVAQCWMSVRDTNVYDGL